MQVATVELQINDDANPYLLTAFTITTSLLVCSTMMALMISTCVLPYIQAVVKMGGEAKESPHEEMAWYSLYAQNKWRVKLLRVE